MIMSDTQTKSFYLLDSDLKKYVDQFPTKVFFNERILPIAREKTKSFPVTPIPEDLAVDVSENFIPGPQGAPDVRVLLFQPRNKSTLSPGYLHIHGGGMILGSPDGEQYDNAVLCAELGCTVVSVDYRLAPETQHPGLVEDCYAALKWLHVNAGDLRVDPERIAVGGGSAGAGLAAALTIMARDRKELKIIFQRLQSPMLDDRTCITETSPYNGEYMWTKESNYFGWKSLLGHEPGVEGVSPYASPAREEDLSGLPAAYISVGAIDLFAEESIDYARRLLRAGIPTELHVFPGGHHGFGSIQEARISKAEARDSLEALRRAFFG
jgi:acetyl esterase/lipase